MVRPQGLGGARGETNLIALFICFRTGNFFLILGGGIIGSSGGTVGHKVYFHS